jgi:hypothetical protein
LAEGWLGGRWYVPGGGPGGGWYIAVKDLRDVEFGQGLKLIYIE